MTPPEPLIELQRAANAAQAAATAEGYTREAWQPWIDAAAAVHEAIRLHAAAEGLNRYELEMAVKAAARQADEGQGQDASS